MEKLSQAAKVSLVMLAAILVVLAIFLVITIIQGDTTDHLHENQSPAPASPRPT